MTDCVCFHIKGDVSVDEAWAELEVAGLHLLYSSEEVQGKKEIYGCMPEIIPFEVLLPALKSVASITPTEMTVDWSEQWELHAADFQEGYVQFDLKPYGFSKLLRLQPGPGFGDLSHPTTRLVIELMAKRVKGEDVLDIGCGSGILSLCAQAMGARSVYGVDIDPAAIQHANKNAELNQMELTFSLPGSYRVPEGTKRLCILMNMIRTEQKQAWNSLQEIHDVPGTCLISGVLKAERDEYLKQAASWGWTLQEEIEKNGWLGFSFELGV